MKITFLCVLEQNDDNKVKATQSKENHESSIVI